MPSTDRELQILADVARSNRVIADAAARAYERRQNSPSARRSRSPAASRRSISPPRTSRRYRRPRSPPPRSRYSRSPPPPPPTRTTEFPPRGRGGINRGYKSRGSQPRYRADRPAKQRDIGNDLRQAGRAAVENFIQNAGKKTDKATGKENFAEPKSNEEPPGSEFDFEIYGEQQ